MHELEDGFADQIPNNSTSKSKPNLTIPIVYSDLKTIITQTYSYNIVLHTIIISQATLQIF